MFSQVMPERALARSLELPSREYGDWFVLRSRSRQEKIIAKELKGRSIAYFLPLLRQERNYSDRRIEVEIPMFNGYMFLRGTLDDAYTADRTGRVAQIIPVPDQDRLDFELANLAQLLGADARIDPYPYLRKGVRVEVRSGPLRGLQGLVEDVARRHRIVLQVDALGQAVSVEIDAAIVDLLD